MPTRRIEQAVSDFEAWKRAFDRDPIGREQGSVRREQGGVRHYQIPRPVDDPNVVMIDLEFESMGQAETFLANIRELWSRVDVIRAGPESANRRDD